MMQWFSSFKPYGGESFKSDAAPVPGPTMPAGNGQDGIPAPSAIPLTTSSVWREPLPIGKEDFQALMRMDGFKDELLALRSQWVHERELRVVAATWNVAGIAEPPADVDLSDWLALERPADVYAIGFQEIVPLNTSTMLGAVDTEQAARRWEAAIRSRLDEAAAHLDPRSTLSFSAADLASADDPQSSSRSTKSFPRNSSTSSPQRSIPATVAATGTATATATAVAGASAAGLGSADGDDAWKGRGAGDARPRLEVPQYEFEEDLDQVPLTPMGEPSPVPSSTSGGAFSRSSSASASIGQQDPTGSVRRQSGREGPVDKTPSFSSSSGAESARLGNGSGNADSARKHSGGASGNGSLSGGGGAPGHQGLGAGSGGGAGGGGRRYYTLVASKQMVGIHLCVWVRTELREHVHGVQACSVPTALMGFLGNKGAVGVSLCIHETSFCFLCAHLTAGEEPLDAQRRTLDFSEIMRRTAFVRPLDPQSQPQPQLQQSQQQQQLTVDAQKQGQQGQKDGAQDAKPGGAEAQRVADDFGPAQLPCFVKEHDRVILLGDLNYRLDITDAEARLLISQQDWDTLLENDQLHMEMQSNPLFKGCREGMVYFAPTYKYMRNSNNYVGDFYVEGEKRRTPAWTDRVLWMLGEGEDEECLRLLSYGRSEVQLSDHRPVSAVFLAGVEVVDAEEFEETLQLACANLDARQRLLIPSASLSSHAIDFGEVGYSTLVRRTVEISNGGQVAARFQVKTAVSSTRAAQMEMSRGAGSTSSLSGTPTTGKASASPGGLQNGGQASGRNEAGRSGSRVGVGENGGAAVDSGRGSGAEGEGQGQGHGGNLLVGPRGESWLQVEPREGLVSPGHTVTLNLHTWVSSEGTRVDAVVERGGILDLILVVSVEGGGDLFVECSALYVPSSWGLRLEWLSAVGDRAVRSLKCAEIVSAGDKARASGLFESASSFPKPSDAVPAGPSHGDQPPEPGEAQGTPAAAGTDSKGGSSATEGVAGSAIGAVTGALLKTLGPLHALDAASIPLLVPKELRRMIIHLADCGQDVAALFDLKGLGLDLSWLDDDVIPGVSQRLPRGLHLGAGAEAPAPGSPRKLPRLPSLAPGAPVSIETEVGPIRECLDTGEPFPTISGAGGGAGGVSPFSGPGPLSHPLPPRAHSNLGPGSSSSTPAHPESPSVSPGDTETVPRAAAATPVGLSNLGPSAGGVPPADLGSVANTGALDGQRGGGGPSGAILAAQLEHPQLRGLKVKPLVLVPRSPSLNSSPTAAGHSPGHGAPGLLTHRAVAKALVSFLLALPEPVVPEKPAQWEVDATDEPWGPGAAAALLASSLPPLEMAVVDALLSLIHSLLRNRIANRLAVQELAVVLAATLFAPLRPWSSERAKPWSEEQRKVLKRRVRFMQALVEDARLKGFAAPLERP